MASRHVLFVVLPALLWLLSRTVACKVMTAWAIGFYLTCCLRDLLWLPRLSQIPDLQDSVAVPDAPQTTYDCPCSDSFSATLVPVYLLALYRHELGFMYFGLSFVTIAGIAAVLLSRVYLGVASLAAVSVGAILAVGIAACWSVIGDDMYTLLVSSPTAWMPLLQPLCAALALLWYPIPIRYTSSFAHAAGVVGITSGFLLGSAAPLQQLLAPLAIEPLQPIVCLSGAVLCFLEAVIRCLAGSAVLYFTKTGVGRLAKPMLSSTYTLVPRVNPFQISLLPLASTFDEVALSLLPGSGSSSASDTAAEAANVGDNSKSGAVVANGGSKGGHATGSSPSGPAGGGRRRKHKSAASGGSSAQSHTGNGNGNGNNGHTTPLSSSVEDVVEWCPSDHYGMPWSGAALAAMGSRVSLPFCVSIESRYNRIVLPTATSYFMAGFGSSFAAPFVIQALVG